MSAKRASQFVVLVLRYLPGYYDTWLRKARDAQRPFYAVALAFSQQVTSSLTFPFALQKLFSCPGTYIPTLGCQ